MDHAKSDMHKRAMLLLKKEQSTDVRDYAPIARSIYRMDQSAEDSIKKKFDIAYMIAKEGIAFLKMKSFCQIEERHGVDLGEGYKNDLACSTFVDYIAQDLREQLKESLQKAKFFSLQMDGSTDSGNIEEELFMVVFFDPLANDGCVHVRNMYFCVRQPKNANASGLYECFNRALCYIGVDEESKTKLVGFGCDGAAVNMGTRGLRGLLQDDRPWIFTVWCLAHRLELALKDALKGTLFSTIDEILLRVYYIYSKSPKKCRALEEIVEELKFCLEADDFPSEGGTRPLRACGTRFIAHKVAALERLLDRFGAYLNHLISLTEDPTTKSDDKQKLKGYISKWRESKILLGCAVFHDIIKPAAILCKVLQGEELCIVSVIEALLKTTTSMEKLKTIKMEEFPSVRKVLLRIKEEDNGEITYQGVELIRYSQGLALLKNNYSTYIDSVLSCLRSRLKPENNPEDMETLTHALKIIATHGWDKTADASFGYEALQSLCLRFCTPLQEADVNSALVQQEWEDMVFYAKQYINLVLNSYKVVWWKLFNSPDAVKWGNVLALVELIFTIPLSNGGVERCFSQLKITKSDRRTGLKEDRLDHLLRIRFEGPPLVGWDPSKAMELWWKDKPRRVNHRDTRASSIRHTQRVEAWPSVPLEDFTWDLMDWETWLEPDSEIN